MGYRSVYVKMEIIFSTVTNKMEEFSLELNNN